MTNATSARGAQQIAPLTRALLTLCARPDGFRNEASDRAELERITGQRARAEDVSPRLRRLQARHQVLGTHDATGRRMTYTITAAGRALLSRGERTSLPGRRKRRPGEPVHQARATWRQTPMQGSPIPTPLPKPQQCVQLGVSSGIDARYELTAAERETVYRTGPLMCEWRALRGAS